MFCVKKATTSLLFDNHLKALDLPRPQPRRRIRGQCLPDFFVPRKFFFEHVIKRITLNCFFPQKPYSLAMGLAFPAKCFCVTINKQ